MAMLTEDSFCNHDTYSFLVCKLQERVTVPGLKRPRTVIGFPLIETDPVRKNFCIHAAASALTHFWHSKDPSRFRIVPADEVAREFRKTDDMAMVRFFKRRGHPHPCHVRLWHRTLESVLAFDPCGLIYSLLESGFPVIATVKTDREMHTLTFVGHTMDKHAWLALADISFFNHPSSGNGKYHSNMTWIRHFIVQDTSLGPYYYLPTDIVPKIIAALVVPTISKQDFIHPIFAQDSAYTVLRNVSKKSKVDKTALELAL
jgi:hypothetical protein